VLFSKNKKYNINTKAANETLQNVFAACEIEPNETPLEVIRAINIASAAVVKIGFYISIALLVVVLMMPFAFKDSAKNKRNDTTGTSVVKVTGHYLDTDNGCFVMTLSGDGILYDKIYAKRDDGSIVIPSKIDEDNNMIFIPFTEGNINIYIPKEDGSVMQAVLSR